MASELSPLSLRERPLPDRFVLVSGGLRLPGRRRSSGPLDRIIRDASGNVHTLHRARKRSSLLTREKAQKHGEPSVARPVLISSWIIIRAWLGWVGACPNEHEGSRWCLVPAWNFQGDCTSQPRCGIRPPPNPSRPCCASPPNHPDSTPASTGTPGRFPGAF